jgi:hypothetical protein
VDVLRRTKLQPLALRRHRPCVVPSQPTAPEVGQAPIRLKNLPRQATDALQADGVRAPEIGRLLAHCERCSMVAGPVAGQPAGRRNKAWPWRRS